MCGLLTIECSSSESACDLEQRLGTKAVYLQEDVRVRQNDIHKVERSTSGFNCEPLGSYNLLEECNMDLRSVFFWSFICQAIRDISDSIEGKT